MFQALKQRSLTITISVPIIIVGMLSLVAMNFISYQSSKKVVRTAAMDLALESSRFTKYRLQNEYSGTHFGRREALHKILSENADGSGVQFFIADQDGYLVQTSWVSGSQYQPSLSYSHPDCIVRCTMQTANDTLGKLGKQQKVQKFRVVEGQEQYSVILSPLRLPNSASDVYLFSVVLEDRYPDLLRNAVASSVAGSLIILILLIAAGYMVSQWVTRPLKDLNRSAQRIGQGDWDHQFSMDRNDEIGQLAKSFMQMAKRLSEMVKNLEGLVEERTSDIKELLDKYALANKELESTNSTKDRFFSIIAHDLKSPFMALKGYSGIIEDSFDSIEPQQMRDMINKISVSAEEAHGLLENLLQWAIIQSGGIRVKWEILSLIHI